MFGLCYLENYWIWFDIPNKPIVKFEKPEFHFPSLWNDVTMMIRALLCAFSGNCLFIRFFIHFFLPKILRRTNSSPKILAKYAKRKNMMNRIENIFSSTISNSNWVASHKRPIFFSFFLSRKSWIRFNYCSCNCFNCNCRVHYWRVFTIFHSSYLRCQWNSIESENPTLKISKALENIYSYHIWSACFKKQ